MADDVWDRGSGDTHSTRESFTNEDGVELHVDAGESSVKAMDAAAAARPPSEEAGVPNRLPWPEDGIVSADQATRKCNWLCSINDALFYSYMSRILDKGAYLHKERRRKRRKR